MFSKTLMDLGKPRWLAVIRVLKTSDGMTVRELAGHLGVSYMAAKQYGEDLTRLGYLRRVRTPRTAVGRPEITYRLAPAADAVFPVIGTELALELLENARRLFGENAPERLLNRHFESLRERWSGPLDALAGPLEKAAELASLRCAYGAVCVFETPPGEHPRLVDHHHPLAPVLRHHPRAAAMETRLIQDLLGTAVERSEGASGDGRVGYLLTKVPKGGVD